MSDIEQGQEQEQAEQQGPAAPRNVDAWAKPVSGLHVEHELPADAINLNVEGKRVASMAGGFGKMWQKTYRISLQGSTAKPADVIKTWKEHFPEFWPKGNRFFGPLTSISPGDVALLNLSMPGRVKLSTGILVIYADDESFSFMTPEGHMFNGMITFSARDVAGTTTVQIDGLIRAQDPIYELGLTLGGHGKEDRFWMQTLEALARYHGVEAKATTTRTVVDRKRQWKQFGNVRRSAALKSGLYMVGTPFRALRRSKSKAGA